jgi:hypothetical protein
VNLVKKLIESGVDVDSRYRLGQTALLATNDNGAEGNDRDDAEVFGLLLRARVDLYVPDGNLYNSFQQRAEQWQRVRSHLL